MPEYAPVNRDEYASILQSLASNQERAYWTSERRFALSGRMLAAVSTFPPGDNPINVERAQWVGLAKDTINAPTFSPGQYANAIGSITEVNE